MASRDPQLQKEKSAYYKRRDEWMKNYYGKWIAIQDGELQIVGETDVEVALALTKKTGECRGFIVHVGYENNEIFNIYQCIKTTELTG